jgi:acylphosphatase
MAEHDLVAKSVIVRGRVQGVYFRDSCRRVALEAGVAGWVRNELDGTVAAHLEGSAAGVDRVVEWMRNGPPHAVVDDVAVAAVAPVGVAGFAVR